MSTFAAIYDFEGQVEAAFKAFLEAAGLTAIDADTVEFQKARPRVNVVFQCGPALDHMVQTYDGVFRHDIFSGTLALEIITAARTASEVSTHKEYRAKVRNAMAKARQNMTMTNLALVYINTDGSTTPSVDPENGVEESQMNFAIRFGILSTAWPANAEEAGEPEEE
jgi:hypothetical protein